MPSINDISIALNSLFLDIKDPITLGLNKNEFLKKHRNVVFQFSENNFFEFNINPVFRFDSPNDLISILEKEKHLSENYQDSSFSDDIEILILEKKNSSVLEEFFLDYSVEIDGEDMLVIFNTNSMIFKYEVIG